MKENYTNGRSQEPVIPSETLTTAERIATHLEKLTAKFGKENKEMIVDWCNRLEIDSTSPVLEGILGNTVSYAEQQKYTSGANTAMVKSNAAVSFVTGFKMFLQGDLPFMKPISYHIDMHRAISLGEEYHLEEISVTRDEITNVVLGGVSRVWHKNVDGMQYELLFAFQDHVDGEVLYQPLDNVQIIQFRNSPDKFFKERYIGVGIPSNYQF